MSSSVTVEFALSISHSEDSASRGIEADGMSSTVSVVLVPIASKTAAAFRSNCVSVSGIDDDGDGKRGTSCAHKPPISRDVSVELSRSISAMSSDEQIAFPAVRNMHTVSGEG